MLYADEPDDGLDSTDDLVAEALRRESLREQGEQVT